MPLRTKTASVRVLEALCGYPFAITVDAMRYHHMRHHRDNGLPTDPYFKAGLPGNRALWLAMWLRGVVLVPFWTLRPLFGLASLALPGMRNAYGKVFLQDRSGTDLRDSPEVKNCARAELGLLLFQLAVAALWVISPSTVVYGYVYPVLVFGLLASYRLLCEHNYIPAKDRRIETLFATTRDHNLGILGRIALAPRNIGLHIVHHLHPQVALENLPALRRWYVEHHPDVYPHE
jgi:fatty acid desaturase